MAPDVPDDRMERPPFAESKDHLDYDSCLRSVTQQVLLCIGDYADLIQAEALSRWIDACAGVIYESPHISDSTFPRLDRANSSLVTDGSIPLSEGTIGVLNYFLRESYLVLAAKCAGACGDTNHSFQLNMLIAMDRQKYWLGGNWRA